MTERFPGLAAVFEQYRLATLIALPLRDQRDDALGAVVTGTTHDRRLDDEQTEHDPIERIRRLLQTYVDFTLANDETHRGLLLFVRAPDSTTDARNDPDNLALFASIRRAVEAGQLAGLIRDGDPRMLAQLLWSGVHGALALPINIDTYDLIDGPSVATEMIATLTRSITTPSITTASITTASITIKEIQ